MPRRSPLWRLWCVVGALACNTLAPGGPVAPRLTPAAASATSPPPPATVTLAPPTQTPTARPTVAPAPALRLSLNPGPPVYAGDVLSLGVTGDADWREAQVSVRLGGEAGPLVASGPLAPFGLGGRPQATFWWVWDTAGLAGPVTLAVTVNRPGAAAPLARAQFPVDLRPAAELPEPERQARWAEAASACCHFHYLTGTAAARDIDLVRAAADRAFAGLETRLGVPRPETVTFTLLSRLLGHGGFATQEIYLTYIDRNAAGLDLPTVFIHEGAHILDQALAPTRPALLAEGLAVYLAGGHYRPEDLDRRAAALLASGRALPLADLARGFYTSQHEIGYLQAGSLVKYLVDTYGWEQFRAMYADFQPAEDDARMLAAGLRAHYQLSLAELDAAWRAALGATPAEPGQIRDLTLTIALYDTLRRYQQAYDPGAYFLTAWLPDGPEARRRGLVADFVRSPRASEAVAVETMLAAAQSALSAGDFDSVERLLAALTAVLDAGLGFQDPLAARYLAAVQALAARGYEAQTLDLLGPTPQALAIRVWPALERLSLYNGWR